MTALAPTQILLAQATVLGRPEWADKLNPFRIISRWTLVECISSFSVAAFMVSVERLLAAYWSALASYRTVITKHQLHRYLEILYE
jgi:hypothetical protein